MRAVGAKSGAVAIDSWFLHRDPKPSQPRGSRPTFVLNVDVLFAGFGSNVASVTDAVLLTIFPGVVTFTTNTSV